MEEESINLARLKSCADILREYRAWRLGADTKALEPSKVTEALKTAIVIIDEFVARYDDGK